MSELRDNGYELNIVSENDNVAGYVIMNKQFTFAESDWVVNVYFWKERLFRISALPIPKGGGYTVEFVLATVDKTREVFGVPRRTTFIPQKLYSAEWFSAQTRYEITANLIEGKLVPAIFFEYLPLLQEYEESR